MPLEMSLYSVQLTPSEQQVSTGSVPQSARAQDWLSLLSRGRNLPVAGSCGADTTPPFVDQGSTIFRGPADGVVTVGSQVSLTISVTGNRMVPAVTVFNGAGSAILNSTPSPYTFKYTIQSGDTGPVVYTVETEDDAGNRVLATLMDPSRIVGASSGMMQLTSGKAFAI